MRDRSYRVVREHWAGTLDCDPAAVLADGTTVTDWDGDGVELLVWPGGGVLAAPPDLRPAFDDDLVVGDLPADLDRAGARSLVGPVADVARVHGPQFVGYCDAGTFEPATDGTDSVADGHPLRDVQSVEPAGLASLRERCPAHEWERSAVRTDVDRETVASTVDGEPVAATQLSIGGGVAGVATVAAPDRRGEGHATAAVSRAVERALDRGLVAEYRTVERWEASAALARNLGFERVARSLLVELDR